MDVLIRKEHDAPVLAKQGVCAHQRELGWGGFVLTKGTGTSTEGEGLGQPLGGKESGTNSTEWGDLGPALWVRGSLGPVLDQGGLGRALGQGVWDQHWVGGSGISAGSRGLG